MIKALIFDCFGVLTTDGWHPFKRKYLADDPAKAEEAVKLNKMANDGRISYQDMTTQLAELAGISSQEVRRALEGNAANEPLFEYIRDLVKQHGYRVAMLSNAADDWTDRLFNKEQNQVLEEVILSCDIGVNKPSADAYMAAANKLGVQPEECVFVDDQQWYVDGAKAAGMQAIRYLDFDTFIAELGDLIDQSKGLAASKRTPKI